MSLGVSVHPPARRGIPDDASGAGSGGVGVNRREFLRSTTAATGAALFPLSASSAMSAHPPGKGLVDVNVSLGHWPLRRLPSEGPERLMAKLRQQGVVQAWAGDLEGLLHKDLGAVNARLAEACRRYGRGRLLPFGSVNPRLPDWEEELRRCVAVHHMRGLRLHPNYHGYPLDHPDFARLLERAAQHRLIVQVVLVMEDERMMHPLLRVEPVDPAPLVDLLPRTPDLRLVLLNALRTVRGDLLRRLISAGEVWVEISMREGVGGVRALLEQVPVDRVLFGSHAPLFYVEAAALKLEESPLTEAQRQAIGQANARRLLRPAG